MRNAMVFLCAAMVLGCSTADDDVELAAGYAKIDGQPCLKLLDIEHGRRVLHEQTAPGLPSHAIEHARNQRSVVATDDGVYLCPELDPAQFVNLPPPPRKREDEQVIPMHIFGADNRTWPNVQRNMPASWDVIQAASYSALAMFAYEIDSALPIVNAPADDLSDTRGAAGVCSGVMVTGKTNFGDGSGMVGVSAAHCINVAAGERFWRGWAHPHNRTARRMVNNQLGDSFVCRPIVRQPAAWTIDGNGDYDIMVLDWASQFCGDNWKHDNRLAMVNVDSLAHFYTGGLPPNMRADMANVRNIGTPLDACGTAPAATMFKPASAGGYPKLPVSCGMTGSMWHFQNQNRIVTQTIDWSAGHSGGPLFWDNGQLLGVVSGSVTTSVPPYGIGIARASATNAWLMANGVQ